MTIERLVSFLFSSRRPCEVHNSEHAFLLVLRTSVGGSDARDVNHSTVRSLPNRRTRRALLNFSSSVFYWVLNAD